MPPFIFSTFSDIRATDPQRVQFNLEGLNRYFSSSQEIQKKNDVREHLSMVVYKEGGKRGHKDIKKVTGFICDFDFTDPLITHNKGIEFIHAFLKKSGILDIKHFWYSTFSYTPTQPNFRLVIPLDPASLLSPQAAEEGYDKIFYKLNDFIYLDPGSKVLSHMFAAPCHKVGAEAQFGGDVNKPFIDIKSLPARPQRIKAVSPSYDRPSADYFSHALSYIDPDCCYDEWIKTGMALRHELGDQGFYLWQEWSEKGAKYAQNSKGALQSHWKSFRGDGVTGKFITWLAKENNMETNKNNVVYLSSKASKPAHVSAAEPVIEVLPPEFEDEHHVFKKWGKFNRYKNIYDVSPFPFLNWINTILIDTCNPAHHDMRLAALIATSGHILKESYKCPFDTNFYIMALMPTGRGKNKFLHAINALLSFFNCSNQVCGEIGSAQGLHKHLKMNDNKAFNLVDEIAEMLRIFQQRGNEHKEAVKRMLKTISTEGMTYSHLIKGEELEKLNDIFMSVFWMGTQESFRFLVEDDFRSGMQGRFLYFYIPREKAKFGVFGKSNHQRMDRKLKDKIIEAYLPVAQEFSFGEDIIFPEGFYEWSDEFTEFLNKKEEELGGEQDVRSTVLVRAAHQMKQLAVLTCDERGVVPWKGIEWATSVVIHSLKTVSVLTQERFNVDRHVKDVREVKERLLHLSEKMKVSEITQRSLCRSLTKMNLKRIEKALERLVVEEFVALEAIRVGGATTTKIHIVK